MAGRHHQDMPIRPRNGISETIFDDEFYENDQSTERMTSSYTEIAFPSAYEAAKKSNTESSAGGKEATEEEITEENCAQISFVDPNVKAIKRPESLVCDKSVPYELEGTVSRDGNMIQFVTENLEYKLKLSSPVTKKDLSHPSLSSRNSTPSTSASLLPRNFLQSQLPQIDSNVMSDIEIEAQYLATSVDNLSENLCNLLHSISSITADNVEIHKNSVNKLTDSMDANIKCMYTIMAKTEEISKSMKPTEQLAQRIREIKRLVDMMESNL